MIKTKRAAVAAACAVGATAGLVAMSGPAFAHPATGTAVYNCSYTDPSSGSPVTINNVNTTWQHSSSNNLTIRAFISSPVVVPANGAYATVNGVQVFNAVPLSASPLIFGPKVVAGPISAPNPLVLQIVGPPAVTVTCTLVSSSGFPV